MDANKAVVRKFIDGYNARDLSVFDDLVSPEYVDRTHQVQGREKFKQLFTLAFQGFPDWHETVEDMVAEGDWVWVRVKATGTHKGDWSLFGVPLPATGKKVTMAMVFFFRVVDGKLVEGGEVDDSVDFFKQLGIVEFSEKGKQLFPEDTK
ncbi:MAG: ester cyclase [Candidatus Bathyarchaeota archaeon]|nr:ester cyclase [Candidatus Bathyarchaeota archaeon]